MNNAGITEKLPWLDRHWYDSAVSREEANAFCRNLARRHYENFRVVSFLLPRKLRQHFCNVYAYCRIADDFADELGSTQAATERLQEWKELLDDCYREQVQHPVFVALRDSISRFDIPKEPFERLLLAFQQDQVKARYDTWEELLGYCRNSANPVGHLVLYLCGYRDLRRQSLSDDTCTALQLTNFWQDVARDYRRGRIYLPQELMRQHGYDDEMLAGGVANDSWVRMMQELISRTRSLFHSGLGLRAMVRPRLRLDIELFSRGGLEVLRQVERIGYNTLHLRPTLTGWSEVTLTMRALSGFLFSRSK
jgi:squalene synthase HpnC